MEEVRLKRFKPHHLMSRTMTARLLTQHISTGRMRSIQISRPLWGGEAALRVRSGRRRTA